MSDDQSLPPACYRVSSRAIIFDERLRILVIEDNDGKYELPGGGWEFKESFEECVRREIKEELGVETLYIGETWFSYRGRSKKTRPWHLRICAPVLLKSTEFKLGPGMRSAYFVTKSVFMNTKLTPDEEPIKAYVDKIWPPVEKNSVKR